MGRLAGGRGHHPCTDGGAGWQQPRRPVLHLEALRAYVPTGNRPRRWAMAREAKDRSIGWLMEHHAGSLARAVGLTGFTICRSGQNVLTFPKRAPDGLIELEFPKGPPLLAVLEVTTYPDAEEAGQA